MARDLAIAAALIGLGVLIGYLLFSKEPKKEYHVVEIPTDFSDCMNKQQINYYDRNH